MGNSMINTQLLKGPVIRATFFFNLSCNIVAVQVETLCCAYYHLRGQPVSQQNTMLQVEAICCEKQTRVLLSATNFSFVARITTETSTCLATNLTSTLVIGCQRSAATRQIKKNMADAADGEDEFQAVDHGLYLTRLKKLFGVKF